jgi:transcriptional regulator with XRE-family HTH domain
LNHTEIIDKIFKLRKKLGLKQKEFAPMIGVQPNTLSRWENKKNVPLPMAQRKMKEILKLNPKLQVKKIPFGRIDVLLRFMQKRREERNNGKGKDRNKK